MILNKLKYGVFYVAFLIIFLISDLALFSYNTINASVKYDLQYSETVELINNLSLRIKDMNNIADWDNLRSEILQIKEQKEELLKDVVEEESVPTDLMKISVSAYTMGKWTASGTRVRVGVIAASHDLLKQWDYGSTVILYTKDKNGKFIKYGEYILEDKMHPRWKKTCDIYMKSDSKAFDFGRRTMWAVNE